MSNPPDINPQKPLIDQRYSVLLALDGASTKEKLRALAIVCACDCFNHLCDSLKDSWRYIVPAVFAAFTGMQIVPAIWPHPSTGAQQVATTGTSSTATSASSPSNP